MPGVADAAGEVDVWGERGVSFRPGKPVPIDGRVVEGALAVDQRMFTGESRLAECTVGDPVLAASMAVGGRRSCAPRRRAPRPTPSGWRRSSTRATPTSRA